jgi:hypothetical protein
MPNNPNYHLSEFRESAHQSRLSIVARGSVNEFTKLGANFETDFQSAGVSANSVESNSYGLRLRLAYATPSISKIGGRRSSAGSPGVS